MKRALPILLVGALLCAAGAWFVTRARAPNVSAGTPPAPVPDAPPREARVPEASAPQVRARTARKDLTRVERVALRFKGPQATLDLRVLDATSKDPVADVAVSLSAVMSRDRREDAGRAFVGWTDLTRGDPPLTDGGGRLSLRVPASCPLKVHAEGKGLRTEGRTQEIPALEADESRSIEIAVATEGDLRFFGEIVDSSTKAPVAGVEIQLERRPSIEPIAVSDGRGRFDLWTNSWESKKASASKRGFVRAAFEVQEQHASESRAQRLELTPAATIQGFYRDSGGAPVVEGSLRFWTRSGFAAHIFPREDGWFDADSLPTGEAVLVDLELEHRLIARSVASVVLAPGELRRMDCKLPPLLAVRGIVLDELGAPVVGCEVALYCGGSTDLRCQGASPERDLRDSVTSDSAGRFEFTKATEGPWVIGLLRLHGRALWAKGPYSPPNLVAGQNLALSAPGAAEVVLRCPLHTTIGGHVLDPDGRPVWAGLRLRLAGCAETVECRTDRDGSFAASVPGPDVYELWVEGDGRFLDSQPIRVRGGENDIVLKVQRAPLLRVRVVDLGTRVPLRAELFGIDASTGTRIALRGEDPDGSGRLVFPCAAGNYRLFARSAEGRCGTLEDVRVDSESSAREWTVSVAAAKLALVRSSGAGGRIAVQFSWNGIPIDQGEIQPDARFPICVPPGTLGARYRREDPVGEWQTFETIIDDSSLLEIDLPFP